MTASRQPRGRLGVRPVLGELAARIGGSEVTPVVLLAILAITAYRRALTPGWTIVDGDLLLHVEPYRSYLFEAWRHGRWLPLWNPHIFMGAPFLANLQGGSLYPLTWMLAPLPITRGITWLVVLHVSLAGIGLFAYGQKALRLGRLGSVVAGLDYMLGALMVAHIGQFNQLNTLAWTPWAMLAADRAVARPTPPRVGALAGAVALVILAGHTQQAYFTFLLMLIAAGARLWIVALRRRQQLKAFRSVAFFAGGVALGVGLAALQLAATLELVGQSIRGGGLSQAAAASFSLPARGFLGDLLPDYTSEHATEFASSVGAASLPLMALAVVARWRRPRVWFLVLGGILALAVAFGPKAKLYDVFYFLLPGFNLFRVPARVLMFSTIAAALLAGQGVRTAQQLAIAWRRPSWRPVALRVLAQAMALAALPVAIGLAVFLVGNPQRGVLKVFPPLAPQNLNLLVTFELLVGVIVAIGISRHRAAFGLLPFVVFADLSLLGSHTYPMNPLPEKLTKATSSTASLIPHGYNERYLLLVPEDPTFRPLTAVPPELIALDKARYEAGLRYYETQSANLSMTTGALDVDGYDGGVLPLRSYVEFRAGLLPPDNANTPDFRIRLLTQQVWNPRWLEEAGVTTVVTLTGTDPNPPGSNLLVPAGNVGELAAWRVRDPSPVRARLENGTPARIVSDTGERVVVQLPPRASGRLVLADAYYPGWTAVVAGRPVRIQRYAGYMRAVSIPDGASEVVFEYRPGWLAPALVVNALALGITLGLLIVPTALALHRHRRLRRKTRS